MSGEKNLTSAYRYLVNRGGGQRMVPENPDGSTATEKGTTVVGTVDEEQKKILNEMRARVADVPEYIRLLKSGSLLERRKSAEALGEIGDERGVLPLIGALNDPSATVQYVAAKSLGMLADNRAVDPLISLLKSEDKWVRLGAAHALGLIGDKKAVDAILPLLTDTHHDLRAHAAAALGKLMDARAVESLKPLLNDPKEDVRAEAKAALGMLGVK
jgi:HEAT repeat protein